MSLERAGQVETIPFTVAQEVACERRKSERNRDRAKIATCIIVPLLLAGLVTILVQYRLGGIAQNPGMYVFMLVGAELAAPIYIGFHYHCLEGGHHLHMARFEREKGYERDRSQRGTEMRNLLENPHRRSMPLAEDEARELESR